MFRIKSKLQSQVFISHQGQPQISVFDDVQVSIGISIQFLLWVEVSVWAELSISSFGLGFGLGLGVGFCFIFTCSFIFRCRSQGLLYMLDCGLALSLNSQFGSHVSGLGLGSNYQLLRTWGRRLRFKVGFEFTYQFQIWAWILVLVLILSLRLLTSKFASGLRQVWTKLVLDIFFVWYGPVAVRCVQDEDLAWVNLTFGRLH